MKMTIYRPTGLPETVSAQLPIFAVAPWFWQACAVLVLLTCFSPNIIGKAIWTMPTLRGLVEMVITRNYSKSLATQDQRDAVVTVGNDGEVCPCCRLRPSLRSHRQSTEAQLQAEEKEYIEALTSLIMPGLPAIETTCAYAGGGVLVV